MSDLCLLEANNHNERTISHKNNVYLNLICQSFCKISLSQLNKYTTKDI